MARSVASLLESWREGQDVGATLKLCERLVRMCVKPGATTPMDNKTIDSFCDEAHDLFAKSDAPEVLLAIAGLCVTIGSLDRAEDVLESMPESAQKDVQFKRLRGKINLHRGVQGARGAPAGGAAHLLTGITHNKQLRSQRAAHTSGQMRAVTPPPGSLAPAPPSSNPSTAPRRSFTPSPFANVPPSAPPSSPMASTPAAPQPVYSAPPAAAPVQYPAPPSAPPAPYSAPPSAQPVYSAPPSAPPVQYPAPPSAPPVQYPTAPSAPAAPYSAPPSAQPEPIESATMAHQYSPQELLALVTNDPNVRPQEPNHPSGAPEFGAGDDPSTRGFDFSQGLPHEAFRPDGPGPSETRTVARHSPLEDPEGPTRGRAVPEYLMRLAAEAASGETDQDGPTRGREIPDYNAQLAAEAAVGEDAEGPTRGQDVPPHVPHEGK